MRLGEWPDKSQTHPCDKKPVEYFLDIYLQETQEDKKMVSPLLEYYMTEKAMVCTFMSILYDNQFSLGKQYLNVAHNHAQKLKELLESSVELPNTHFFTLPQSVFHLLQKLTKS
jgi:hypothetical protein